MPGVSGVAAERFRSLPGPIQGAVRALGVGLILLAFFGGLGKTGLGIFFLLCSALVAVRPWIGGGWWKLLAAAGLPQARFRTLPRTGQRALKALLAAGIFMVVVAAFGSFNVATFLVALVSSALYVTPLGRVPAVGRFLPMLAALAVAVTYPYYFDRLFTIPIFGVFPSVQTAVYMVSFMIMAVGLNMVVGYAGLLDLGYVAFYAMGAYTAAWLASLQFPQVSFHLAAVGVQHDLAGLHVSIWIVLVVAAILTSIVGVIIGLPTLRLRGDYLAIVTLGFGEIMPQIARNGDSLHGFNLTNGPNGITPIDAPGFGRALHDATGGFLPASYVSVSNSVEVFFWTALVLLMFTVFCSYRLRDSRLGRAWIAIREDETAAAAMGVPLMRTKTWAYASGAFFGGIAGAYFASFKSSTFPGDFFFNISIFILSMVILGGMGNIWGVLLGGAFLAYLNVEGLANIGAWLNTHPRSDPFTHLLFGKDIEVPLYASGIYGAIILIVMLVRPQGLIPSARRKRELESGVHDEPAYDAAHH